MIGEKKGSREEEEGEDGLATMKNGAKEVVRLCRRLPRLASRPNGIQGSGTLFLALM